MDWEGWLSGLLAGEGEAEERGDVKRLASRAEHYREKVLFYLDRYMKWRSRMGSLYTVSI